MSESFYFDMVESVAVEQPSLPDFVEKAWDDIFSTFTDSNWSGIGPVSNLSTQSTYAFSFPPPLEERDISRLPPETPSKPSSISSTFSGRATEPLPASIETRVPAAPSTPPTSVSPTPVRAQRPPDVATPPPTLDVDLLVFTIIGDATYTPSPSGPAFPGQDHFGQMTQAPDDDWSGELRSVPQQFPMESTMAPSFPFPWGYQPVPQQQPLPTWPTPVAPTNPPAMAPVVQQMPMHVSHASLPAMSPPVPAPSGTKRTFEFLDPEVPTGFKANPDNHGRFEYTADGRRVYLNGPEGKKLRTGAAPRTRAKKG